MESRARAHDEDPTVVQGMDRKVLCQKSMVIYIIQVVAIFIIIIVAVCNLSLKEKDKEMWITLLCSSMGYLLPNPSMKRTKRINGESMMDRYSMEARLAMDRDSVDGGPSVDRNVTAGRVPQDQ